MREFLKPWRRKIGVFTLVMACVMMAAWVRSLRTHDEVMFAIRDDFDAIASAAGGIRWAKVRPRPESVKNRYEWTSVPLSLHDNHDHYWKFRNSEWRHGWGGFDFGVGTIRIPNTTFRIERWVLPYWSIVIPLALLSVWLLVSRPRQAKPSVPPTPEKRM